MIAADLLAAGSKSLQAGDVPNAQLDARRLLAFVLNCGSAGITPVLRDEVEPALQAAYLAAIARRKSREPIAQIIGFQEFMGHSFRVTKDTLAPRPDSETLVASALDDGPAKQILDLGTGTGCLIISLLLRWPEAHGVAVDKSPAALKIAAENAKTLGVAERLTLQEGDWFDGLADRFDVILSNPPYIGDHERAGLEAEVKDYEPALALFADHDGLAAYEQIIPQARNFLTTNGRLHFECAPPQAAQITNLLTAQGYKDVKVLNDLTGRPRVVRASA